MGSLFRFLLFVARCSRPPFKKTTRAMDDAEVRAALLTVAREAPAQAGRRGLALSPTASPSLGAGTSSLSPPAAPLAGQPTAPHPSARPAGA